MLLEIKTPLSVIAKRDTIRINTLENVPNVALSAFNVLTNYATNVQKIEKLIYYQETVYAKEGISKIRIMSALSAMCIKGSV